MYNIKMDCKPNLSLISTQINGNSPIKKNIFRLIHQATSDFVLCLGDTPKLK